MSAIWGWVWASIMTMTVVRSEGCYYAVNYPEDLLSLRQ